MYAYAATEAQIVAQNFLTKINEAILFPLITFMMALALLIFLYGAFEYVRGAGNDGDRETGKRHLLWGTIGMLVMLSAMAILYVAAGTFGLDDEIDDIRDAGERWDSGIFGSRSGEDFTIDRGPSEEYFDDDPENAVFDDEFADDDGDAGPVEENLFGEGDSLLFEFHKEKINDAHAEVTFEDVAGFYYVPNGQYPADYQTYQNTELRAMCQDNGGNEVFSISVNNDTGRQFYCVR